MQRYLFKRQSGDWYIDLPEYLRAGGKREDLQMVAGADEILDFYAGNNSSVSMLIDTVPFKGADRLHLLSTADPQLEGGAYYAVYTSEGKSIHGQIWLCGVLLFVFGEIPENIYIRKLT